MLPMGTIVTVCMLIGLLLAVPYTLNKKLKPLPALVSRTFGGVVLVAGAWNTFWHGFRNVNTFWGIAALVSGLCMMLTALYIMRFASLPLFIQRIRPLVLLGLLLWFLKYATTIILL